LLESSLSQLDLLSSRILHRRQVWVRDGQEGSLLWSAASLGKGSGSREDPKADQERK
jgi:hypothetical protein